MNFQNELKAIFKKNNINLTNLQANQFEEFYKLLIEWNKKINLTSIIEPNEVIIKHFLDSVLPEKSFTKECSVIDIGCGAGFPGIPLKILRPDITLTLVDSTRKKLNFVQEVAQKLELKNISTLHSRAEDLALSKDYREKFDFCIARAVAELNVLSEYCLPFVKIGGKFLAYKSKLLAEEFSNAVKSIKTLGGEVESLQNYEFESVSRTIVFIKKSSSTPSNFPRGKNLPRTKPIV